MKIFSFAKKEFELIISKRSSLALVILYPLIIVLVIAIAFGGQQIQPQSGFERADVAYYLPFESENFDSQQFLDKLSQVERLKLHRARSPEDVKTAINQGIARIGIVVQEPTNRFETVKIKFYYDNTAPLVSSIIMSYADFSVSLFASEKSVEILTDIWTNLDEIKQKLGEQYTKIEAFEQSMDEAKQRMLLFEAKVNGIDIESVKTKLDQFDTEYDDAKQKISDAVLEVSEAKDKLDGYEQKLTTTRSELAQYSSTLKSIRSDLQTVKTASPEPIKAQLLNIENELSSTITKIDTSISEIDSALVDIGEAKESLDRANLELGIASEKLDSTKQAVEELKETVSYLESTIEELKGIISESYEYHDITKANLAETKALLNELTGTLENFMNYEPEYLVRPFKVEQHKMYLNSEEYRDVEKTAILIPISITLVLLLTCILFASISAISERKQGLDYRVHVSPTTKPLWLLGKILGQLLFAFLEAAIILGITFFVLSVPLIGPALDLFIVLFAIALVFIAIGTFFTNFTSEQSTAVLAALLIMIPLIFLSGLLFPIEFMPFYIQGIANSLPLTIGSTLLTNVIIKGIPLVHALDKLALLIIPSIVLFAITLLNKKI